MITLLILSIYIISIFISRYLNYRLYKLDDRWSIEPLVWFMPIGNIIIFTVLYLSTLIGSKPNWFTGKYW
jgi:hypothetical protein